MCCIPQCNDAKTCPLRSPCPYKTIFEPSPPPDADQLSKNHDIPRPFVICPPQTRQSQYEAGEQFDFGLVLIGPALELFPYFVLSFKELARVGLGLNRAKCILDKVEHADARTESVEHQV